MGGGAIQGTDLPPGEVEFRTWGDREEDGSREEFRPSWHWRSAFSTGSGLVPYSAQIFLEAGGRQTLRGATLDKGLESLNLIGQEGTFSQTATSGLWLGPHQRAP